MLTWRILNRFRYLFNLKCVRHIEYNYKSSKSQAKYNYNVSLRNAIPQCDINTAFSIGYVTVGIFIRLRGVPLLHSSARNKCCGCRVVVDVYLSISTPRSTVSMEAVMQKPSPPYGSIETKK